MENCEIMDAEAHTSTFEINQSEVKRQRLTISSNSKRVRKRMECCSSSAARESEGFPRKYFGSQCQQLFTLQNAEEGILRFVSYKVPVMSGLIDEDF